MKPALPKNLETFFELLHSYRGTLFCIVQQRYLPVCISTGKVKFHFRCFCKGKETAGRKWPIKFLSRTLKLALNTAGPIIILANMFTSEALAKISLRISTRGVWKGGKP
jgi:hypothetical protein